jgi:hypothetical protein
MIHFIFSVKLKMDDTYVEETYSPGSIVLGFFLLLLLIAIFAIIFYAINGNTKSQLNEKCTSDRDCAEGTRCDITTKIPICKVPLGGHCEKLNDCWSTAKYCDTSTNFTCEINKRVVGINESCSNMTGCNVGLVCDSLTTLCKAPIQGICEIQSDCLGTNVDCVSGICEAIVTQTTSAHVPTTVDYWNQRNAQTNKPLFEMCGSNSECSSGYCMMGAYYHLANMNDLARLNNSSDLTGAFLMPLLTSDQSTIGHKKLIKDPNSDDLLLLKMNGTVTRISASNGNVNELKINSSLDDIGIFNNQVYAVSNGKLGMLNHNNGSFFPVSWAPAGITAISAHSQSGNKFEVRTPTDVYTFIPTENSNGMGALLNQERSNDNISKIYDSDNNVGILNDANNTLNIGSQSYKSVSAAAMSADGLLVTVNSNSPSSKYINAVTFVNSEPFFLLNNLCVDQSKGMPSFRL